MAAIGTRYPDKLIETLKKYPRRIVADYTKKAGEIIKCERATVEDIIKAYAQAINDQGVKVERVLLFGSYARGDARADSDIDLIIVSSGFRRKPAWKRWEILGKAAAKLMEPIEAMAYTPEELSLEKLEPANFLRYVLTQPETVEYRM